MPTMPAGEADESHTEIPPGPAGTRPDFRDPLILGIFIATLALYLVSMPKTVALEDDSIFILSGYFNGVSHPPGYPLFTLVLHLFTQVPLGDVAARAHACSAFFAALGCCFLYLVFCQAGLARSLAALGTIVFAVSGTFWSQAIVTEVYSLNLFLNLGLFLFAYLIYREQVDRPFGTVAQPGLFILFSVFLGLALANHWPLTLLALPGYLLLLARPFLALRHKFPVILPGLAVTGLAYLYLYFNNQSAPFINFSGAFGGIGEFVDFVMRSHYASVDQNPTAGLADKAGFGFDLLIQFGRELNLLLVFALFGIYRLLESKASRVVGLALLWVVFANSFLLVLLINFDYGELYSLVFRVYPMVSVAMLFVAAGFGISMALTDAVHKIENYQIAILLLCAFGLNLFFSLPQNYRHDYVWGEEYARRILADIPPDAILFSDGEVELGLLGYYRYIEGRRQDIQLFSSSGLLLDNRLFDYRLEDKKGFIEGYVEAHPQQAFYVANNYYRLNSVSGTLFSEKLGHSNAESRKSITSTDIDLVLQWSATVTRRDPWTRLALEILRQKAISILTPTLKKTSDPDLEKFIVDSITRLIQSDEDLLHFLTELIRGQTEISRAYYEQQLDAIERGRLSSKQMDSHYVYLAMLAEQVVLDDSHFGRARQAACSNWPSRKNTYCVYEISG